MGERENCRRTGGKCNVESKYEFRDPKFVTFDK